MAFQAVGNGVAQCANGPLVGTGVSKEREVGIEHLVRLADGDREAQPVAGRGRLRGFDVVLLQPSHHSVDGLLLRRNEALHL